MSREIKFRVWDKSSKVMKLWGNLLHRYNTLTCLSHDSFKTMQYTGLKDKNEKEIYEGDIVVIATYSHEEPLMDTTCIVEYNEVYGIVEFVELDETGERYSMIDIRDSFHYELEVIGNIYENPELLEGKYNE